MVFAKLYKLGKMHVMLKIFITLVCSKMKFKLKTYAFLLVHKECARKSLLYAHTAKGRDLWNMLPIFYQLVFPKLFPKSYGSYS